MEKKNILNLKCIVCNAAPTLIIAALPEEEETEDGIKINNGYLRCPNCYKEYWIGG